MIVVVIGLIAWVMLDFTSEKMKVTHTTQVMHIPNNTTCYL